MKIAVALLCIISLLGCTTPPMSGSQGVGAVPDEVAAVRIAEAALIPIYGSDHVYKERPFKAILEDGVWKVSGSFPQRLPLKVGGVLHVTIAQQDGSIIEMYHTK